MRRYLYSGSSVINWSLNIVSGDILKYKIGVEKMITKSKPTINLKHKKYTKEQLLQYMKQFYVQNKRVPEVRDFINNPKYPGWYTYIYRFGSWNSAIKEAELQVNVFTKNTDKELLEYLIIFDKENNRPPTSTDFINNPKYPGFTIYLKRFKTWYNALKMAGLDRDILIKKGIINNTNDKGRLFELCVKEHFEKESTDLAGEKHTNPYDGICPTGQKYDAKSCAIRKEIYYFFRLKKLVRNCWYYLGGYSKNYEELSYVWRIYGSNIEDMLQEKDGIYIGISNSSKHNIINMKKFDITNRFKEVYEQQKSSY